MRIRTIKSEGISALSYFVSSNEEAMVIDPRRDASVYKHLADKEEVIITHIFETHRNEDFVIGSLELKNMIPTARIGHSNQTNFRYGDDSLSNNEIFTIGKMRVKCLQTPGHTNDSICYVVADMSVGTDPIVAFTGDTLFVNEVGRTDLVDKKKHEEMSRKLYNSLHEIVMPMGDGVIIHPGHGAGSVCGGDIGDREFSTIGFERINNIWLNMSEDEFVESKVKQRLTLASYFKHCEYLNTIGPPIVADLPKPTDLDVESFSKLIEEDQHRAIDTRPAAEFLERHIPGSISLGIPNMGLLAGWVLRPSQTFSIILHKERNDLEIAVSMLYRIGYDNIVGYLRNGLEQWVASGHDTASFDELSLDELGALQTRREVKVIDVREPHEFDKERIEDSVSSPLTGLEEAAEDVAFEGIITTICPRGSRATTAASILKRRGIDNIAVSLDGLKSWKEYDYPLEKD
ncbi:MAG: rhodanese-like domain-containing protein [Candidatus Thorarchaeota archaeon]